MLFMQFINTYYIGTRQLIKHFYSHNHVWISLTPVQQRIRIFRQPPISHFLLLSYQIGHETTCNNSDPFFSSRRPIRDRSRLRALQHRDLQRGLPARIRGDLLAGTQPLLALRLRQLQLGVGDHGVVRVVGLCPVRVETVLILEL